MMRRSLCQSESKTPIDDASSGIGSAPKQGKFTSGGRPPEVNHGLDLSAAICGFVFAKTQRNRVTKF